MKTGSLILCAFALMAMASCEKGEKMPAFPATLTLHDFDYQAVHVYTQAGEMTDPQKIAAFLKGYEDIFPTTIPTQELQQMGGVTDIYVKFHSPDSASFSFLFGVGEDTKYHVGRSGREFLFSHALKFYVGPNYVYSDNLQQHKPYRRAPLLMGLDGEYIGYMAGQGDYRSLTLYGINYAYQRNGSTMLNVDASSHVIFDRFDSNALTRLAPGDTLAVQQYRWFFR